MTFPNHCLLADRQLKTIRLASSVLYLFSSEICGSSYVNSPPLSAVSEDPQSLRLTCISSSHRSYSQKKQLKSDFSPKLSVKTELSSQDSSPAYRKSQEQGQASPCPAVALQVWENPTGRYCGVQVMHHV